MLSLALVAHHYMYVRLVFNAEDVLEIEKGKQYFLVGNNAFSLSEAPTSVDNLIVQNVDGTIVPVIKRSIHKKMETKESNLSWNSFLCVLKRADQNLVASPLLTFGGLLCPSFIKKIGCKVKIRLLVAHTVFKAHAYCCMKSRLDITKYQVFVPFLSNDPTLLEQC